MELWVNGNVYNGAIVYGQNNDDVIIFRFNTINAVNFIPNVDARIVTGVDQGIGSNYSIEWNEWHAGVQWCLLIKN